ncbi:Hint domain-containing protein [Ovoidimarina sediminis]|uniref:Hint domain-containing protein n=1 Tax=Ovoidimarina sediminis TaxID=3079856 RepID=UPI002910FF76|nr:Hint domain-containing protein [Rhodophyticola sp. MJ-SS7]MDU8942837.1 Hint domain-containing protein [Rhodophyticola sp. MJ-SS7]
MRTGRDCTFVISWSQTEVDGLRGAPLSALEPGVTWSWTGTPTRVDGPADILPLDHPLGQEALQARAAAAARRILGADMAPLRAQSGGTFDDALLNHAFKVTDGRRIWSAMLVEVAELARPLLMFVGAMPPSGRMLWVAEGIAHSGHFNRITESPTGVICFTRGTRLRTPAGEVPVEDLAEGDRIDTVDGGAQEIVWIGRRRMSGARLYAMPELRPIRIRAGALGSGDPNDDLVVSPRHKVLVRGAVARALFNTDEVLVAADDLMNDRTISRDHTLREVEYVHLLLPRHHVVWANGVETESFHPASTNLDTVSPDQRARLAEIVPGIESDPHGYGAAARRELTRSEAAILRHEAAAF